MTFCSIIWTLVWKAWLLTTIWIFFFPFLFPPKKRGMKKRRMKSKNHDKKSCLSAQSFGLWYERHDFWPRFGYSFSRFSSLLKKEGWRKGEWKANHDKKSCLSAQSFGLYCKELIFFSRASTLLFRRKNYIDLFKKYFEDHPKAGNKSQKFTKLHLLLRYNLWFQRKKTNAIRYP